MADKKKTVKFNKKSCDWRYNAACTADTDCSEDCPMPCPYDKKSDPCSMCGIKGCRKDKCKALKIYNNRKD